jgi:uncharacterized membrane protein
MNNNNILSGIFITFPIMIYLALESLIIGLIISLIWRYLLYDLFQIKITFLQISGIYWIVKMLLFNVFNLVATLMQSSSIFQQEKNNINEIS